MSKKKKKDTKSNITTRPPVVVVMGHIDHGKSTLLDYIRKTNVVDKETGGITQAISAYEVVQKNENKENKITFIDTPGHAAFSSMRERGANVADIAILIVSAEDGVKPQTVEAWKTITDSGTPFVVAINKIDKPGANVERTKTDLAENGIFLENYGGDTPFAAISAKEGTGVDELLSLIGIMTEMEEFSADTNTPAEGFVIEADMDPKRGTQATLIIKNGTLEKGMTVVAGGSVSGTRIMEDFQGKMIKEATFSSPIRIVGFDTTPPVGAKWKAFEDKNDAIAYAKEWQESNDDGLDQAVIDPKKKTIPIVLKADTSGSIEAIEKEIAKIQDKNAEFVIIAKGEGKITEANIKNIADGESAIVIGFNVKADNSAKELAERRGISISFFDIIYKMTEWLEEEMERLRPRVETEEILGKAKILKTFSKTKERQVVGGKVKEGKIALGSKIKIMRREFEIGKGKVINLEKNKAKTSEVEEGSEFGMMIEAKVEIAPGDMIEAFQVVRK